MLLQVLGTAAGGGLPQWNCACPGCSGARAHPSRRRRHASLAVRADEGRWYLVNATPDIGDQIEDSAALRPGPGPRDTPVAGIVLTDAELDHTLGIARLREADGFSLVATARVRRALTDRLHLDDVLAPYTRITWRGLDVEPEPLHKGGSVEASAVPVSAKRPRYAADVTPTDPTGGHPDPAAAEGNTPAAEGNPPAAGADGLGDHGWVTALKLRDTDTGRSLLYAPALAAWTAAFQEAVDAADCVILDGTFWDDEEPRDTGISACTATEMGHLPIAGPRGTARRLATARARCLYTHLNNTNPLTNPESQQHALLGSWGLEVAADRMVIEL
ncbi:pyrroloquinoline quinone biosynthesis protein PqqB [Streptomyces sp. NPDC017979]|uniref:pyrroloquinoline quinone biosynthesis protein PqqB n=1 Tax=Streptomyces sp. NPDC017979 TaxID=3365024 RepID=UPI003794DABB